MLQTLLNGKVCSIDLMMQTLLNKQVPSIDLMLQTFLCLVKERMSEQYGNVVPLLEVWEVESILRCLRAFNKERALYSIIFS